MIRRICFRFCMVWSEAKKGNSSYEVEIPRKTKKKRRMGIEEYLSIQASVSGEKSMEALLF
jgi:hypothetical protein